MINQTLNKIGLTNNEVKIYITLLEIGSSTTGEIIRKSGLHSSRVYEGLEKLGAKGLVSYVIKSNRKNFETVNPERLMDYLEERKRELEQEKIEVRKIIPELISKKINKKSIQEANIYSGHKGIRSLLSGLLQELNAGEEYFVFGAEGGMMKVLGEYFEVYQKEKRKLRIKSKVIFGEKARKSKLLEEYEGEARFIHPELSSPTDTFIYNDKIILFVWDEKPPFAILIKNKSVANSYRNYFKVLWKSAKK